MLYAHTHTLHTQMHTQILLANDCIVRTLEEINQPEPQLESRQGVDGVLKFHWDVV